MQKNIFTICSMTILCMMSGGCQLLLDNRAQGKASVVVVPTAEWDEMRAAKLRSEMVENTVEYLKEDNFVLVEPTPIISVKGSNSIQFSNRTDSSLAGCSAIGAIEIRHKGTMDDAVIILKNEAHRLNTNVLVPISMEQSKTSAYAPEIQIEARMMRCPLKLARGN